MPFGDDPIKTKEWASKGGSARAFVFAEGQLQKMQEALDRDLAMVAKIQMDEEIDEKTERKLNILKDRIKTYTDKLHTTKSDITVKDEGTNLSPQALEVAKKYEEELNKLEDESGKGIDPSVDSK